MFNKNLFKKLKKEYDDFRRSRREVVRFANDALAKSKQAIFAFHRGNREGGENLLKEAENIFDYLNKKFKKNQAIRQEGALKAAHEEFLEAKFFGKVLQGEKLNFTKNLEISLESYLGALCDLTGELVRSAINKAAAGQAKEVEKIKKIIGDILEELVQFDLTGYLRTKYDQAKHNLKKIEEIYYDIKIRK